LSNRINRTFVVADFAVRMGDAATTYIDDGSGACPTCHEKLLPAALSRSLPGMLAYSAGVSVGLDFASAHLWRHGHHRLARLILIADIVYDGSTAVHNVSAFRSGGLPIQAGVTHPLAPLPIGGAR
jgi:hypothetical protein